MSDRKDDWSIMFRFLKVIYKVNVVEYQSPAYYIDNWDNMLFVLKEKK